MILFDLFGFINIFGLIFIAAMITPHVIFARSQGWSYENISNKSMLYIERIGKYGSLFLMMVNTGLAEGGFTSDLMSVFWAISTAVLVAVYVVLWVVFYKKRSKALAYALTILASFIFIYSGLLSVKVLLLTFGIIYLAGSLYVVKRIG